MVGAIRLVDRLLLRRHGCFKGTSTDCGTSGRYADILQVKHDVKARLTLNSSGSSGGEGARTHIQVLANSVVASALTLLHARQLSARAKDGSTGSLCWPYGEDLLVVGIVS